MKFNSATDGDGLIQLCEDLTMLGRGGISNNATLLKTFTGYLNLGLGKVWTAILKVDKNAKQDDLNYTDIPNAPITLVQSQSDYTLPVASSGADASTFQRLNGIYYVVANQRVYLEPMDDDDEFTTLDGFPAKYQIEGKSIFLNIPPSDTFIGLYPTLHVEFQRIPSFFVSSDTTKQAGFLAVHHPLLAFYASAMYLKPTNLALSRQYSSGREDIPADFESGIKELQRDILRFDSSRPNEITSEEVCSI
jgi:hypothetical protein